jgi:hypothetical protein
MGVSTTIPETGAMDGLEWSVQPERSCPTRNLGEKRAEKSACAAGRRCYEFALSVKES